MASAEPEEEEEEEHWGGGGGGGRRWGGSRRAPELNASLQQRPSAATRQIIGLEKPICVRMPGEFEGSPLETNSVLPIVTCPQW